MIQVNGLSKHYGERVLFEDVTFNVNPGERVGIVGRNGSGKSTLFKIIQGEEIPDSGEVVIPKGQKVGSLKQHLHFTKENILEECALALPEDKRYEVYRAEKILSGLGFNEEDMAKAPSSFSGGYQIRLNLAKLLLQEPQTLLLDEPTNYLDILSVRWLKDFLRSFPGEVLLITHDRYFMDEVITHVMGIKRRQVKMIKGNTEKYYQQIREEEEIHEKTRQNQEKKKKEIQEFVDRFRAQANKASQAQSKLKQIEKMEVYDELEMEAAMSLHFEYKECPGKFPLKVDNLGFAYKGKPFLFQGLNFSVARQDRLALIGKNGKGKSTLLNVLAGELDDSDGDFEGNLQWHHEVALGHFGQTNVLRLNLKNTVEKEVELANPKLSISQVRGICGAMMFSGDDAKKKIQVLSGGERSRVLLGKILAKPTNLLLLDEPTNHLDMESIEILTKELRDYPGAIIFVTHSEELLRRLAKNLVIFRSSGAEYFHGGYDDFLRRVGWEDEEPTEQKKKAGKKKNGISRKEYKRLRQELVQEKSKGQKPLSQKKEKLEGKILNLEQEHEELNQELISASQKSSGGQVQKISQKMGKLDKDLETHYRELDRVEKELQKNEEYYEKKFENLDERLEN